MIEIYEGRVGGGKSYTAIEKIAWVFSKGGTVATNIEILWPGMVELVEQRYGVTPVERQWVNLIGTELALFHRVTPKGSRENQVLVVLDEAHLHFNSRDWAKTERETLAFLTQSRKQYTDIIFISQSATNIDKQFRVLNQHIWRFRDLQSWTVPVLGIPYPVLCRILTLGLATGNQLLQCKFDYDGTTLLKRTFRTKSKLVFGAYNTNALVQDFPREGEAKIVQLNKVETTMQKIERQLAAFGLVKVLLILALFLVVVAFGTVYVIKRYVMPHAPETAKRDSAKPETFKVEHGPVKPAQTPTPQPTPSPQQMAGFQTLQEKAKAQMAYDIYSEDFVAFYGPGTLKTTGGTYEVGQMSGRGFVQAVSDRRVKVAQPDGRTGWVITELKRPKVEDTKKPEGKPPEKKDEVPKTADEIRATMTDMEIIRSGFPTTEMQHHMAGTMDQYRASQAAKKQSEQEHHAGAQPADNTPQALTIRNNKLILPRVTQPTLKTDEQ